MRTAAICPTCATYTNSVCVIYDGPYLSNLGINPMSSLDDALQQINFVAGTFEKTANKSTNTSLGTSNTLYPTQNAVKTYVDAAISTISTIDLQQVTDVGSVTTNSIVTLGTVCSQDDLLSPSVQAILGIDTLISGEPYVSVTSLSPNKYGTLWLDRLDFGATGRKMTISTNNLTSGIKSIELPDASGTFALSVNGNAASTTGNVSVNLQSVLNAGNSLSGGNNFQGTNAGVGNTGTGVIGFGTSAGFGNTGSDVIGFGLDAVGGNTGDDVTAFGTGAAQGNTLNGVTVFSNLTLPTYADHAAAVLAITVPLGATPGCTYLYHNQATNSIGAVRL